MARTHLSAAFDFFPAEGPSKNHEHGQAKTFLRGCPTSRGFRDAGRRQGNRSLPPRPSMVGASRDLDHSLRSAVSGTVVDRHGRIFHSHQPQARHRRTGASVVFLLIAVRQMVAANPAAGIWVPSTVSRGTWILCGILSIVSAILLWLLLISRGW